MRHVSVVFAGAAAALLMAACDRAPEIAGPQNNSISQPAHDALHNTTNEMDLPWTAMDQDSCTGDVVAISGVSHFLLITTDDGSGGFHLSSRVNSTGTGLGAPSGFIYNAKDDFTYSSMSTIPGATIRQEEDVMILGPASVDNYIHHMIFKLTIDANGVPTASFDRSYTKCVG